MRASLVLCTRNRAHRLDRTLDALAHLEFDQPWELVIVDNGSADNTPAVLEAFRRRGALTTRIVQEPRPGLCRARNQAVAVARGEFIAFTDDDCFPVPDFLTQLDRCFGEADIAFVGGRVLLHDNADLPLTLKLTEHRIAFPPRSVIWPGAIHGANMAFRRDVLARIGGFDEALGAGTRVRSGGDSEALARASAAGYAGAFDPRPVVRHDHGRKTQDAARALHAGYDLGRGGFFAKCMVDRAMRPIYWHPIWWHIRDLVADGQFGILGRELRGGMTYLGSRTREANGGR